MVLLGGWIVLAAACSQPPADATTPPKDGETRPVRLVPVTAGTLPRTIRATGTLAAEDQVALNTKVAGRLAELPVDLGSVVQRGDPVAMLDVTDFGLRVDQAATALAQARARLGVPADGSADRVDPARTSLVREARAVLERARLQRERLVTLHADGILSQAEFDAGDAEYRVAEARWQEALEEVRNRQALVAERRAQLAFAEQQLADATLRAPFDGVVRERHLSVGGFLDVGAPVVTIVRVDPLRLRLAVPEREAGVVRIGQPVTLRIEGDPAPATGTVVRLSPAVDEATRTLLVEAEVPNADRRLRPGGFATAEIVVQPDDPVVLAPADAVVAFAGVTKVLTVVDGKVAERRIRTGRRRGEQVEVVEGLQPGEAVVAAPGSLVAGQAVRTEP